LFFFLSRNFSVELLLRRKELDFEKIPQEKLDETGRLSFPFPASGKTKEKRIGAGLMNFHPFLRNVFNKLSRISGSLKKKEKESRARGETTITFR